MSRNLDSRLQALEQQSTGTTHYMVQVLADGRYKIFYCGHGEQPDPVLMTADEYHAFSSNPQHICMMTSRMDFDAL